jgi:hypothetical protein
MRIIFNHGISLRELYTNTFEKITDKNLAWFRKTYNVTTREEGISLPFKYVLGLILRRVIEDRVRFIIPWGPRAYIDFEAVTEEDFEIHRQGSGFQDIDFIESDFTGYKIWYHYGAYKYDKKQRIYLGGDLKKTFTDKINSEVKFYTIKDIELKEFRPLVYDKFPELSKTEINKILEIGFRRMNSAIKMGCALSFRTPRYN